MSKDRYLYHSKHLNKDKLLQSVGSITVQSYCKSWTFVECSHLPQKLSIGNKASPKPQYLLEEVLQSTVKSVRFYSSPGGLSNSITRATCKLKGSKDQGEVQDPIFQVLQFFNHQYEFYQKGEHSTTHPWRYVFSTSFEVCKTSISGSRLG